MERADLIAPQQYNIVMEIERHAKNPNKKALIWLDDKENKKEISYQALMEHANQIGNVFLEYGFKKGDKLLVMMPRLIEAYEIYLAALKTGIIIIPASEMLMTADLQYRVTHGEIDGIVTYYPYVDSYEGIKEFDSLKRFVVGSSVDNWLSLDELKKTASRELEMAETTRDDIAFLPYTSGTTANPKAVIHTHGWGYAHLRTVAKNWLGIKEDDTVWATAAPGWQKWVWSPLLSVLGSGVTGFVYHGRFDPQVYLNMLENYNINVLCCTPTEYRLMVKVDNLAAFKLPELHSAVSAGEPLNREVFDVFQRQFGISVRDGYGQTENTLLIGVMKDMDIRPGSMGKPTPGNDLALIDDEGEEVAVGEVGNIAVKLDCPALFAGYYKNEEQTEQAKRGEYYVTGDLASKDADGYFWFKGRSDDIIISSGYTIGPFEVEDVLVKHAAVKECAVVASPDEIRGNIVKAFVVLQDGIDPNQDGLVKELQNHVKSLTAPYKYPRAIEFIDELPKTISDKTRHVELREREK